jgi:diacylglycerol kinase family enzyme
MRIMLLANPASTKYTERKRDEVARVLAEAHRLEVQETTDAGNATDLARRAVAEGVEALVVMGGDGTVNEAVNGLLGSTVPLGMVGGGKANVFARGLGLPVEPIAAAHRLLELIASGSRRLISLGLIGERCFTCNAGLGFDGALVREMEIRRQRGRACSDWSYVAASLKIFLFGYDRDRPHVTLRFHDGRPPLCGFFVLVGNGDPFTYLGRWPFRPMPRADYEQGLDLLLAQSMSLDRLISAVRAMLSPRPCDRYLEMVTLHNQQRLTMEADVPLPLQADGEYLGDYTRVTLQCMPSALTVIAPAQPR